ncbi:hypothetical protein PTKIN_Ptkin04bG0148600 [Pterospermum kingtungense]
MLGKALAKQLNKRRKCGKEDEIEQEYEEEKTQVDSESDEEDQQIYNPLEFPMVGMEILYLTWLYKLHGLGQEFKCEICGNYSCWGCRVLRGISKNSAISMACNTSVFETPRTLTKSPTSRCFQILCCDYVLSASSA